MVVRIFFQCVFPSSCFAFGIQNLLHFEALGIGGSNALANILPTEGKSRELNSFLELFYALYFFLVTHTNTHVPINLSIQQSTTYSNISFIII